MPTKNKPIAEQDRLVRENARLRGDLLTIASRVSHDLRTPLGSILNAGELLREIMSESEPSSAALTEPLFDSVDELKRLIKSVNFVAKASANPVSKVPLQMAAVVHGILEQLESRIYKKGAKVSLPDAWPEVEGVPGWLEFVWWHLIGNAITHGGPLIKFGWQPEKDGHRFWISDNGPGVPAQWRAKLFQPFDSLHQQDSTRGLGLSVVQRLVELQGGHCGYETDGGEACFYFTLPHAKALK
jgi:signal transduction histidine kinase